MIKQKDRIEQLNSFLEEIDRKYLIGLSTPGPTRFYGECPKCGGRLFFDPYEDDYFCLECGHRN